MLDSETITDKQFLLACDARRFPAIILTRGRATVATSLVRKGWGDIESDCCGRRFRLNQAGCDALAWLEELRGA